ncbi:MAG: hypothetical protein QM817_05750 [Archangium sp.]
MSSEIEAAPAELEALFAAERARPGPAPQIADQVLASVQMAIAARAPAAVPPSGTGAGSAAATATGKTFTIALASFLAGGIAGGAIYANLLAPQPAPQLMTPPVIAQPITAAPTPVTPVTPAISAVVNVDEPKLAAPQRPAVIVPTAKTQVIVEPVVAPVVAPSIDAAADLAAERALIEQARTSLTRQRAADAIAALTQHLTRFPRGELSEEREFLWIQALVTTNDENARVRAADFRARFPKSIFLPAVEALAGTREPE